MLWQQKNRKMNINIHEADMRLRYLGDRKVNADFTTYCLSSDFSTDPQKLHDFSCFARSLCWYKLIYLQRVYGWAKCSVNLSETDKRHDGQVLIQQTQHVIEYIQFSKIKYSCIITESIVSNRYKNITCRLCAARCSCIVGRRF